MGAMPAALGLFIAGGALVAALGYVTLAFAIHLGQLRVPQAGAQP